MCGWCKRVFWWGEWVEVEAYVQESDVLEAARLPWLSHGICDVCRSEMMSLAGG